MLVNSSSNSSLPPDGCFSRTNSSIFTAIFIYYILLLPLFTRVLHVGYQRWRQRRSVAVAAIMSHFDVFTFNMVFLELIGVLGFSIFCYCSYSYQTSITDPVLIGGLWLSNMVAPGQTLFHLLTCVERYLAVVHPITYLGLREAGGVRIRNLSIGCVWAVCFGSLGVNHDPLYISIYNFLMFGFSSTIISFCCISVLCVLIRPRPGAVAGNRGRVDKSKQRAFHTLMAVIGALFLRFLGSLALSVISIAIADLSSDRYCLIMWSLSSLSMPSSLVLPLLFLHRAEKLPGCKRRIVLEPK